MRTKGLKQNENFPQCLCSQVGLELVTSVLRAWRSGCRFSGICCPPVGKHGNKSTHTTLEKQLPAGKCSKSRDVQQSLRASWKGSLPSGLAPAQPGRMHATCIPSTDTGAPLWAALRARQEHSSSLGPQVCWL